MSGPESLGAHVLLDYVGYSPPVVDDGAWALQVLRESVHEAGVREVHSHASLSTEELARTDSPRLY